MLTRLLPLTLLLPLLLACSGPHPSETTIPADVSTGIHGTINDADRQPVSGANVYVYRNARSGLRGPADFAATSDPNGSYLLDLAAGSYHLVARTRSGNSESGPPRPGDAWALPAANPIVLKEGELKRLDFTLMQITRSQTIGNTLTDAPYRFNGRLVDQNGKNLQGSVVLAYRQADLHRRPDFASRPADPVGRFTLYLPDAGPWCLVVRQHTRGQLRRGELYARLGNRDGACSLQADELIDLGEIILSPFKGE